MATLTHAGSIYFLDGLDAETRKAFLEANAIHGHDLTDWDDLLDNLSFIRGSDHPLHIQVGIDLDEETITFKVIVSSDDVFVADMTMFSIAIYAAFLDHIDKTGNIRPSARLKPLYDFEEANHKFVDPSATMQGIADVSDAYRAMQMQTDDDFFPEDAPRVEP